jgi:hypothetical protein
MWCRLCRQRRGLKKRGGKGVLGLFSPRVVIFHHECASARAARVVKKDRKIPRVSERVRLPRVVRNVGAVFAAALPLNGNLHSSAPD